MQLVNLETQVLLVRLDGLERQDLKDKLASLAHKVVKRCTLTHRRFEFTRITGMSESLYTVSTKEWPPKHV